MTPDERPSSADQPTDASQAPGDSQSPGDDQPSDDRSHALAIGARLRRVRHQQGMSLADVQKASEGRWKAVVVGAYERGDRTITVTRLEELARFYDVPLADLLPDPSATAALDRGRVTIDLLRLESASATPGLSAIARFAGHVRRSRGDHNGRVLTLRAGDLETIALAIDSSTEDLRRELDAEQALLRLDAAGEPQVEDIEELADVAHTASATIATPAGEADDDPLEVTIDLRDHARPRQGDRAPDRSR